MPRSPTDPTSQQFSEETSEAPRRHRPPPGLALDPPIDPPPDHPPEIPEDRLDPDALKVIARLRHMHHQAYFVGGCVRDLLLGATPKDFDLATDAHPGEVRAIFRNCRLIGRRFRLAHVYFRGGKVIEVATFRKNPVDVGEDVPDDGDLLITRDNVFGTAEEDAVRRDFTVNGLFYDVASGEVIDHCGGRPDLEARRIATIGDPEVRMREDPVRALRAVRFASRLGFTIAPDTFEAMRRHAGELARCAPARVLEEIFKLLRCGGSSRAFDLLRACGALPVILPALGSAIESWDETKRRSFSAHLAALDKLVRSGQPVSDAVLLGALIMHLGGAGAPAPEADEGGERAPSPRQYEAADALLASLVQSARLPRKVAERTRLALTAQRSFREPSKRRRRRGRGLAGQTYYEDAVQLLEISVTATGEGRELLERFRAAAGGEAAPGEPEHAQRTPHAQHGNDGRGPAAEGARDHRARGEHRRGGRPERTAAREAPGSAVERETAELLGEHASGEGAATRGRARPERTGDRPGGVKSPAPARSEPRVVAASSDDPGEGSSSDAGRRRRRRGGKRRRRRGAGEAGAGPSGSGPPPAGS
jgi:poly(A) polymerase